MACRSERAGGLWGYRTYGSGGGRWRGGGSGRNRASGCSLVPAGRHRAARALHRRVPEPARLPRPGRAFWLRRRWRLSRSNRASVGSSRRSVARRCTHAEDRSCDRIWVSHSHGKAAILDKRCGPVPLRASAAPGQCRSGPVPLRASAMPGQCHAGPVPGQCRASAVPRRCWSTGACCRVHHRHVQRVAPPRSATHNSQLTLMQHV